MAHKTTLIDTAVQFQIKKTRDFLGVVVARGWKSAETAVLMLKAVYRVCMRPGVQ